MLLYLNINMLLLKPDMYTNMVRYYHNSNKLILPATGLSFLNNKYLDKPHILPDILTTVVYGYHSLFSISSIITDYIKPKKLQNLARITNSTTHIISITGFIYYICKNNTKI